MEEVVTLVSLVEKIGIPVLFFIIAFYLLFKLFPKWINMKSEDKAAAIEERKEQQHYYNQRSKTYEEQMQIIIKVAEQSNQMIGQATQIIAQATEVIRLNTETIKKNVEVHKDVKNALDKNYEAQQVLAADLKAHDNKSVTIYSGIERLLDRVD